jgi:hypothetical protein
LVLAVTLLAIFVIGTWVAMAAINRPPEDPRIKARRELENALNGSEPVVLIGETGLPRYPYWENVPVTFQESPYRDDSCTFESVRSSELELVPQELAPTSFDLEFDVRHNSDRQRESKVGVYFKKCTWDQSTDYSASSQFEIELHDFILPVEVRGKKAPPPQAILVCARVFREVAGKRDEPTPNTVLRHNIVPLEEKMERIWRRLRIESRPDSLAVYCLENGMKNAFKPRPVPRQLLDLIANELAKKFPDRENQNARPEWEARGAIGLFANRANVSFRNVVITNVRTH